MEKLLVPSAASTSGDSTGGPKPRAHNQPGSLHEESGLRGQGPLANVRASAQPRLWPPQNAAPGAGLDRASAGALHGSRV